MKKLLVGLVAGAILATAIPAIGSWLVVSSGEAGGQLASLEPVKVSAASVAEKAFPGQALGLVADLSNPNPVALEVVDVTMTSDLVSEKDACTAGLDGTRSKFKDRDDFSVDPGESKNVVLGRVDLPSKLPDACQGQRLTAKLVVTTGFGVK